MVTGSYVAYSWKEHSLTEAQKITQLNHIETQAEEANQYIADMAHDIYTIAEADTRYYKTASHPSGPSPATGIDAATVDGYSIEDILMYSVPAGAIGMFGSGAIPDGFLECDGSLGTPNLQGRMPKGAGSGISPGDSGGSNTITPTSPSFESADHALADNEIPRHTHEYLDTTNDTFGVGYSASGGYGGTSPYTRTTGNMQPGDYSARTSHKHTGCTFTWTGYKDEDGDSQSGALDIRPACRAVKFIMRAI